MPDLPSVTSPLPRDLQQFIQRVREAINGGGAEGLITARQLTAAGIASLNSSGTLTAPATAVINSPSAPSNLAATGALANIILTWNAPTYSGHAYTEIYAHTSDVVGNAVIVGMTAGNSFAHNIGDAATRYYWVKNVNRNGLASAFNATNGVQGTTGTSPTYILDLLAGEISEGELATDLATRIDLIDDDASVAGSVAARIATETTNRTTAIGGIEAKYTVKIDNAGHLSGYGLISTANDATPTSEFGIRADKFWVAPPAIASATAPASNTRYKGMVWVDESVTPNVIRYWTGSAWSTTPQAFPLVVATSQSTINGVTVDPGVYIDTAMIADATITSAKIKDAAIDSAKIVDAAITTAKIDDAAITTAKIDDAAITTAKINDAAITAAKIEDAAITTAKINDAAITAAKIEDAAITTAKINDANVTTAKIADANVTTAKIADANITSAKAAITSANIGDLQVDTAKIANGAITNKFAAFTGSSLTLTSTYQLVQEVDIDCDGNTISVLFNGGIYGATSVDLDVRLDGTSQRTFRTSSGFAPWTVSASASADGYFGGTHSHFVYLSTTVYYFEIASTIAMTLTPSAGSRTISVYGKLTGGNSSGPYIKNRHLETTELKK